MLPLFRAGRGWPGDDGDYPANRGFADEKTGRWEAKASRNPAQYPLTLDMTMVVAVRQTATGEKAVLKAALEPLAGSANAFRRDVVARPPRPARNRGSTKAPPGDDEAQPPTTAPADPVLSP